MEYIFPSKNIYIGQSFIPHAGRGVFAVNDIAKGQIIEKCPVILVPAKEAVKLRETILRNYYFLWGNSGNLAIGLGYSSLYNHSYTPNATYKKNIEEKTIEYTTLRTIRKDEEIVVNYNYGNPNDKSPLWILDIPKL
jgi:uncharacterized protein